MAKRKKRSIEVCVSKKTGNRTKKLKSGDCRPGSLKKRKQLKKKGSKRKSRKKSKKR